VTLDTPVLSEAMPEIPSGDVVVLNVAAVVGSVMVIVGGVGSWETVIESDETFPTSSTAVTEIWLTPSISGIEADQEVVPSRCRSRRTRNSSRSRG